VRSALLPAGPDPFLLRDWFTHYRLWADEVDRLEVTVYGITDPEAREFIADHTPRNAVVRFSPSRLDHGKALGDMLKQTDADTVVLVEDDAFVRRSGAVDAAFREVESGGVDIVGSPRSSVTPEIASAAEARFGQPPVMDSGESGNSLWPCFLFAKRDTLLRATDFSAHGYPPGIFDATLNYIPQREGAGDTFVHATYQLRDSGARVSWKPQYRCDLAQMADWLTHDPPWFHVGSLSSGYGYTFAGPQDGSLERIAREARSDPWDWHKRVAWWQRAIWRTDALPAQRGALLADLERFIEIGHLQRKSIAEWAGHFSRWVTW
jgi:hypothetical protein